MPHKHGLSHAIGTIICMISAGLLVEVIEDDLPALYAAMASIMGFFSPFLPSSSEEVAVTLLLASLLMFFWGVGFYFVHKE